MRTYLILLIALIVARNTFAAVTLIGPGALNGSFESGVASPWQGGVQVVQDPTFASAGSYYAMIQAAGSSTAREIAFQFLPANRSEGLAFNVSFDARIGSVGFDTLSVDFFARNSDGSFISTIEAHPQITSLSSSGWQRFETQFHLPETWDGNGNISLQLLFSKTGASSGTTYTGFLDNILLQQVPEPSMVALGIAGGVIALVVNRQSLHIGNFPLSR